MDCIKPDCEGIIEASTTIYLDVEGTPLDEYGGEPSEFAVLLTDISPSRTNDYVDEYPCNVEPDLFKVQCSECGERYDEVFSDELQARVGLQPIGNATRTYGMRGGIGRPLSDDEAYIVTYGEPGGRWTGVTLNLDEGQYEVHNEGGDVLYADGSESIALAFARSIANAGSGGH